jgi:hypothetical protein
MILKSDWNSGGGAIPPRGAERPSIRDILNALCGLTLAEAKALPPEERFDGMITMIDGHQFVFVADSEVAADDFLVVAPTLGDGRFVAKVGETFDIALPIGFGTLDAAVLWSVPGTTEGAVLVQRGYWEVTTGFTGGSSSAIGASSDEAGLTTKGDLHGGAAGNVAATLVEGALIPGTPGTDLAAGPVFLRVGADVRFDRITSVFDAGAGFLHLIVTVAQQPA